MDQREMNVSDLGKVIGSQPLASMILRGERGISKKNVLKLGAFVALQGILAFLLVALALFLWSGGRAQGQFRVQGRRFKVGSDLEP